MAGQCEVIIKPETVLVDEKVSIRLTGFLPGNHVSIKAEMLDSEKNRWHSSAVFMADEEGNVDLSKDKPLRGDYDIVDPMGLFWSMRSGEEVEYEYTLEPEEIAVEAYQDKENTASKSFRRIFVTPDVSIRKVDDMGLRGILFTTAPSKSQGAAIVLGGSSGFGWTRNFAALLASYGIQTLALSYFGEDGLPPFLSEIPLEYFEKAIKWFADREEIEDETIGVVGISKGAELALLLGSRYEEIKTVVAFAPFCAVMQGLSQKPTSSWSYDGRPLPWVPVTGWERLFANGVDKPIAFKDFYMENYENRPEDSKADIEVEKIKGPVMVVSGKDDRAAPSFEMSEIVMKRLAEYNHQYKDVHLTYEGAGHSLGYINTPTTITSIPIPTMGFSLDLGGTPKDTALARVDAVPKVIEFLIENLR